MSAHVGSTMYDTFRYAGVDATDQFAAFHRPRVYARLAQFHVGEANCTEAFMDWAFRISLRPGEQVVGDKSLPTKATEEYRA